MQRHRGGGEVVKVNNEAIIDDCEQYYFGYLLAKGGAVLRDLFLLYAVISFSTSIILMKASEKPDGIATLEAAGICVLEYLFFVWLLGGSRFPATPGKCLMG
ncbi:hypothetical protein ACJJIW_13295 [Microbulbifer sp. JMSA004]|uniref:hypothetical protein n=1 Tax=Microbulbifer sp. JMSA004 TaxID=3243370 RepID=UPI00403A1A8C